MTSLKGYPQDAYYVPVTNRALLQTALDTYKTIRLDPNADYTVGGVSQLIVQSNEKIYGLPGTIVPPIVVTPGTHLTVLSRLQTGTVTFPPSLLSTNNNLFVSLSGIAVASGATVESNLFVDWNGGIAFDDSSSGYFRNNRFIRSIAHGAYNPYLRLKGNGQNASYGNVFLFYNFLTPPGDTTDISGQGDVTFVGVDAESWNWFGWGSHAVITTSSDVDTVRFFAANGGDNIHSKGDSAATGYFDIGAKNFLLYNDVAASVHTPKVRLGPTVANATMLNVPSLDTPGYGLQQDSLGTMVYTPGGNPAAATQLGAPKTRIGAPWEAPVYDPVPDPGGPGWNLGLASKPDSTAYIQSLIDSHGVAMLPAGTYYISQPLRLKSSQGLIGAGMEKTLIIARDPSIDMIVGDDHATAFCTQTRVVLGDLTLQGGTNGIHHDPNGSGPGAQYTLMYLSHVSFRNMSNAGIYIDSITAWDNNFIDHVNFVNCGTGLKQRVSPTYLGGEANGESYLDKNLFYHCQFIGNGVAVALPAWRADNLNVWAENLFSGNTNGAVQMTDNISAVIANSDFVNNGGAAVLSNDGYSLNLVGCRFTAGAPGKTMLAGSFSVEGTNFRQGRGGAAVISAPSGGATSLYDSSSDDMPTGVVMNGYFFNNLMYGNSALSKQGVLIQNGFTSVVLPTAITSRPVPQLLFGAPLQFRY